jgi:hypothetical protein
MILYELCDDCYIQLSGCGKLETGYVLRRLSSPDFQSAARWFRKCALGAEIALAGVFAGAAGFDPRPLCGRCSTSGMTCRLA